MIRDNIQRVRDEIAEAARAVNRDPSEITLVAVSKTRSAEAVEEAIAAGIVHLGENRVQEAGVKIPLVRGSARWHLIGSLQSNKARQAARLFDWIDSLHSEKVADILSDEAQILGKVLTVLVQVNISGEESKSGVSPEGARDLIRYAERLPGLAVRGLMTIGSLDASPEQVRSEFRSMRARFDLLRDDPEVHSSLEVLSMGMSGDLRIAVEEGSTMVRVGTAIFGERS
jgi:PLP dependent protein